MTGSGAGFGSAVCTIATGSTMVRPPALDRSSGTVSVPHSIRGDGGTSSLHGPFANTGVYCGRVVVVATLAVDDGLALLLDMRLLGFARRIPVRLLARHVLPWTAGSFALIVPSGLMMFTAHAGDFVQSGVFVLKMCLIMAAGLNAALFHVLVYRTADVWDAEEMRNLPPPPSARVSAALSLALWVGVIACGRLLAYF